VPATNPVTCTFPVGDANNYAPVSITKTGTNAGTLTGATSAGDHTDTTAGYSGIDANKSVNRTWMLTGGTLASATPYSPHRSAAQRVAAAASSTPMPAPPRRTSLSSN
jgi:hypothetical protein